MLPAYDRMLLACYLHVAGFLDSLLPAFFHHVASMLPHADSMLPGHYSKLPGHYSMLPYVALLHVATCISILPEL
jgi:hypothetical protein